MFETKKMLYSLSDEYEFFYMVIYLEGPANLCVPDLYFKDIRYEAFNSEFNIVLYEWNILHNMFNDVIYDIDGLIFLDPPDELNNNEYIDYIKNPIPLFIPSTNEPLTFCTYRLDKYFDITLNSLLKNGIKGPTIYMFNSDNYFERQKTPSWAYKSYVYSKLEPNKGLFIEIDDFQAKMIYENTKKAVYCVGSNKMYS